jgi:FKBP-type peptidyl-prolyl cis-trans isomerase 2
VIEDGKQVSIEYTLALDDGQIVDSNVGKEPLTYQHGQGQIIPGLERHLAGLKVDDTKKVTLAPEEGYGPVNPNAFQDVKPETVPEDARQVGTMLVARDKGGSQRPIRIHEVHADRIVLDLNHPLAGRNLNFEVRIIAVQ